MEGPGSGVVNVKFSNLFMGDCRLKTYLVWLDPPDQQVSDNDLCPLIADSFHRRTLSKSGLSNRGLASTERGRKLPAMHETSQLTCGPRVSVNK